MKVRYTNGAVAIVDAEYGERLVASGLWTRVEDPKPAPRKRAPKKVEPKED